MLDFGKADDFAGGQIIPHNTLCMLYVKEIGKTQSAQGKRESIKVIFEVAEGAYAGKEISEFFTIGKNSKGEIDYANRYAETFGKYVLETTIDAHLDTTGEKYRVAGWKALETGRVLALIEQRTALVNDKQTGERKVITVNNVADRGYATPRPDSGQYKYWEAYQKGEQPWQDKDYKPEPTEDQKRAVGMANGQATHANDFSQPPAGHPAAMGSGFM